MASTTPSEANVVATSTVASDELSPQISTGVDVLSQVEFRSAASHADLFDRREDEVFPEMPQTHSQAARSIQLAPSRASRASREVQSLGSVNNTGRMESLVLSDSSRIKRPPLDAARKKYEDALLRVNQDLTEFLDTYLSRQSELCWT